MSIYLKLEVDGGTEILHAAKKSIDLADRLQINVEFKFNGVTCFAHPGGDPNILANNYHEAIASKAQYKFAHSTHPQPQQSKQPERIEVKEFWFECSNNGGSEYCFEINGTIPENKKPAIKQAIEDVLNGNDYNFREHRQLLAEKVMFEQQLNEEREKVWKAARERIGGFWNNQIKNWTYPTLEDYLRPVFKPK